MEVVVPCWKVLFQHFPGGSEENDDHPPACWMLTANRPFTLTSSVMGICFWIVLAVWDRAGYSSGNIVRRLALDKYPVRIWAEIAADMHFLCSSSSIRMLGSTWK
jgi:hypothetical protein